MPRLEEARNQTGAGAFDRARRRSAKFAEVKTLRSADEIAAGESPKRMEGRMFVLGDSVWTDIGNANRIPITAVAAFSLAYFALVRMLPELTPYLSAGEDVLVASRRGSIRIGHQGTQSWKLGELAELVRNFRGT